MKKLLIFIFAIGLASGVSAQKIIRGGGGYHHFYSPRVVVGIGGGYSPFYSPFYSPYSPFYSPYGYRYNARPSRLDLDIQDIKVDYADRIQSVKLDKSLPRKERRHMIKDLKYQRDKAIIDARRNYYYNRSSRPAPAPSNGSDKG
jgi:hypothetical protein